MLLQLPCQQICLRPTHMSHRGRRTLLVSNCAARKHPVHHDHADLMIPVYHAVVCIIIFPSTVGHAKLSSRCAIMLMKHRTKGLTYTQCSMQSAAGGGAGPLELRAFKHL